MNRKTLFITLSVFSTIILAACAATAAPTTITSGNTAPTDANVSSESSPVPTTEASNTDPNTASNLACAHDNTSASTTIELTEGPYYKAGSPEDTMLFKDGMPGTKLVITGYVYDTNCQPVANAWLDFWQANANGEYDNSGYTLRGHQYTDAKGSYTLTTVVPGIYPGRTEHIHFKVQAPNGKVITSQLFFPGVAQNDSDGIFNETLLLPVQETSNGLEAQFNFVVPAQ